MLSNDARGDKMVAHLHCHLWPPSLPPSLPPSTPHDSLPAALVSTMNANPQEYQKRDGIVSTLNGGIEALNLAKEVLSITPAKAALGSASILLAMIRVGLLRFRW